MRATVWHTEWAVAAFRVLKPGAHLLAFGGTRTHHRLMCALEDAGFEIRDCLMWLYGQGFPKSLDVGKAIDMAAGAERKILATIPDRWAGQGGVYARAGQATRAAAAITDPATEAARQWEGWGTALKPAWEPIVLARKPLGAATVAANVLAYGTGALHVDGGRIGHTSPDDLALSKSKNPGRVDTVTSGVYGANRPQQSVNGHGRWPANLVLDEAAAAMLDAQSGESSSSSWRPADRGGSGNVYTVPHPTPGHRGHDDAGGASRFFYTAKASAEDRDGSRHPTVKPVALMKWLIRLITPPGGVVLDPFLGSGTTVYAARELGMRAIGIEREAAYGREAVHRLRQGVLAFPG